MTRRALGILDTMSDGDRLAHGDLHPGNVLLAEPGPVLIDWADATRGDAVADGFDTYWSSQIFGLDTLTTLALVGRETSTIKLGTSVVPTYPRHPMMLAQQALTTQAACGGRLTLGIGPSHQIVIGGMYGMDYSKPGQHTEEYLQILGPLSRGEPVSFRGKQLSANGALTVKGAVPFPIVVAALGPRMLEIAGRLSDGTLTWCVGPRTLAEHTVPVITAAAEKAGRAVARIICE